MDESFATTESSWILDDDMHELVDTALEPSCTVILTSNTEHAGPAVPKSANTNREGVPLAEGSYCHLKASCGRGLAKLAGAHPRGQWGGEFILRQVAWVLDGCKMMKHGTTGRRAWRKWKWINQWAPPIGQHPAAQYANVSA